MANDETKTVLDEPSVAAVRLMLGKLADHHVAEAYVSSLASEQRPLGLQAPTGTGPRAASHGDTYR